MAAPRKSASRSVVRRGSAGNAAAVRRPGLEFGARDPRVAYLALRWNAEHPTVDEENRLVASVSRQIGIRPESLRIFNLVRPAPNRGMTFNYAELDEARRTIKRILRYSPCLSKLVVGGVSCPMPLVALTLWHLLPRRIRIELRTHHKARAVTGGPLVLRRVLRR